MAGYTRNDTSNNIATGNVINAADLDGEFDALVAAFHASTGHTHDGTAANGAPITKIGPAQDLVISTGAITPKTDNTVDLGSSSFEFKDLYIDGTANIDALVADTADINAGTIDGVTLGTNSAVTEAQIDNININGNTISSTDTNGNISLVPNGTGDVILTADTIQVGDSNTDVTVTTNGTGDLIFNTNAGTNSGVIRIYDGANGNIALTPNGTGEVDISKVDIDSGAIDGTAIGANSASTGAFTTLSASSTVTLSGGTANGVLYLNGSKAATSGSALTFNGTTLGVGGGVLEISRPSGVGNTQITVTNNGAGASGFQFGQSAQSQQFFIYDTGAAKDRYLITSTGEHIWLGASEQMRLTSTGLGIGTSSISSKLVVKVQTNANAEFRTTDAIFGTVVGGVGIDALNDARSSVVPFGIRGSTLSFGTSAGLSATLDSSGNLGIGTSSPSQPLAVQSSANGSTLVNIVNTSTGGYSWNIGTVGAAAGLGPVGSFIVRDSTNGVTRLVLDTSGNLGLGVTPSAWVEGTGLNVGSGRGGSIFTETVNYGFTTFNANAYYSATDTWKYVTSNAASRYQQLNGVHSWHTAGSGTAGNAITFTQAMTLDASGNLGVGTTSPQARLHAYLAGGAGLRLDSGSNGYSELADVDGTLYITADRGNLGSKSLIFRNGGTTERARITSGGDLLVGATSSPSSSVAGTLIGNSGPGGRIALANTITTTYQGVISFTNGNGTVGTIDTSGSSTSYVTSSDYRLKNTITPMTGALAKVALLKPCTYKWNVDGSDGEGFIAHELAEVCPQAVSGEKDAVDAEGNPQYQGIDTSFLVATLTAAIQEQQALITSLTARVALLEGN